jgi:hypothetical protein
MTDLSGLRVEQLRRMLRVLSRGAARQRAGEQHLERVLHADLERLVYLALEVAT